MERATLYTRDTITRLQYLCYANAITQNIQCACTALFKNSAPCSIAYFCSTNKISMLCISVRRVPTSFDLSLHSPAIRTCAVCTSSASRALVARRRCMPVRPVIATRSCVDRSEARQLYRRTVGLHTGDNNSKRLHIMCKKALSKCHYRSLLSSVCLVYLLKLYQIITKCHVSAQKYLGSVDKLSPRLESAVCPLPTRMFV